MENMSEADRKFADNVEDILLILEESGDQEASMQMMAATLTYILTHWPQTPQHSEEVLNRFIEVVVGSVNAAQEAGAAIWTGGTSH